MQHKYFFLTVLAFLSICQTGSALQCYECTGDCTNMEKRTCPTGLDRCLSVSADPGILKFQVKSCATSAQCNIDYAVLGHNPIKSSCCKTYLCNSAFTNVMSLGTAVLLALVSLYFSQF